MSRIAHYNVVLCSVTQTLQDLPVTYQHRFIRHMAGCLTHLARQAPTRGKHIKELGLPCLDELKGVGEGALAGEAGREGLLGHEHVGNQLVPKLFQPLQNRKKRFFFWSYFNK
jgi:hypothetical protein